MAMALSKLVEDIDWDGTLSRILSTLDLIGYPTIAVTTAATYISWKLFYALFLSPLRNIPGPFINRLTVEWSNYLSGSGRMAGIAVKNAEKYGEVFVHGPNSVVISNPSDCRTVYGSHSYKKTETFYKMVDILGIENIFSTRNPELNSTRRRQIGPSFTTGYLLQMEDKVIEHGIDSIKRKWDASINETNDEHNSVVNFNKDFMYATFDVTGSLVFGREFGALKNDDPTIINYVSDTFMYYGIISNMPLLDYFPFSFAIRKLKASVDSLIKFGNESIVMRRELNERLSETKPKDLLQAFIDAEDPESKNRMSDIHIQAESTIMLLAGTDTSSQSMTWTIHMLMLYPEVYRRVVDEVRGAFASDHLIRYSEARTKLPYLEAVIYESLRLVSVGGGLWPRLAPKGGITIQGHFIPEGTEIYISIAAAHMNKKEWANPHKFDPERYLNDETAKRSIFTFGGGVRICPGRNLAWVEMMTILANLIKDYDFRLPDDSKFGPDILDDTGYPKIMDYHHFIVKTPLHPKRDCRLVITKHQ